ncbi:MAG: HEAT repeat domain-containing protein [Acidobacteria bacterium]|nr:HEAT repeat domain-containing protein [Acidobacteriota bacterium]
MTIRRILPLTVLFAGALASTAGAQPAGAGPIGAPPLPPLPALATSPMPPLPPVPPVPPFRLSGVAGPFAASDDDRADELYDRARDLIEQGKFDRAVVELDRLIGLKSARTDAALYWKAYSLSKLGERTDALKTLGDFAQQFKDSRWMKDARALEVEVRQASGQTVSPDAQNDEELKLLALRGIMNSDPEQALPVIEKMLAGTSSPKVKDRALFVLSQSRSARARDIISGVAKGNANPDLQLKAIRYIGMMGGSDNRQLLADVYRAANDSAVKKAILRSYMQSGDRDRLFTLAKSETDASLRIEAVRQLGMMRATSELTQLYQGDASVDVRKQILQAMFTSGDADKMIELAKGEKDPDLRKTAIRNLGMMKKSGTSEALVAIYGSDATPDVRKAVVNALFTQNNATALVTLARAEKNPEMKKDIVSKLSVMKSKEAMDYLMELLK